MSENLYRPPPIGKYSPWILRVHGDGAVRSVGSHVTQKNSSAIEVQRGRCWCLIGVCNQSLSLTSSTTGGGITTSHLTHSSLVSQHKYRQVYEEHVILRSIVYGSM